MKEFLIFAKNVFDNGCKSVSQNVFKTVKWVLNFFEKFQKRVQMRKRLNIRF